MLDYKQLQFNDDRYFKKKGKKNKPTSDTIYTFDIEVSSLFKINGIWQPFNYDLDQVEYSGIEKAGVPYIFMFGVNDMVYYGRDFKDFKKVLIQISDQFLHKIIWVHNLSYEFQFLLDILDGYTIENMVCRDALKPISFNVKELNIEFRCSYMLTNMSLDKASEEYGNVKKLTGTMDYKPARGMHTPLTNKELLYCEYDIKSLHSVIKYYLNKYDHIANIPLTSTGEVRKDLRNHLDFWYFKNNPWRLVPDKDIYLKLIVTFMGGYTHANMIYSGRIVKNVHSKDIASSYPAVLVTEKFPCQPFKKYTYDRYVKLNEKGCYAWFFEIELSDVKSLYYNHYLSYSKAYDIDRTNLTTDNGRIMSCKRLKMWVTDVDLDIIKINYNCKIKLLQIYGAYKQYLDIRIIKYCLEQYKGKTELKDVAGAEDLYRVKKANNNCIYGMTVTSQLKNSAGYGWHKKDGEDVYGWYKLDYNDDQAFNEFVDDVLEKQKKSYSNILFYATGLWCTAYARRNVYLTLLKIDADELYCDTDSIKYINDHDDIFEEYNKNIINKYKEVIKYYPELKLDDFMPEDHECNKRPIGFFEKDAEYAKFKTLGAKKYAYVKKGKRKLEITIAGVAKSGAKALKTLDNFKKGFKFGYKESGKLTHIYINEQPHFDFIDKDGNIQHSEQNHGVVLQPTTYTIGLTSEYEALITNEYLRRLSNVD